MSKTPISILQELMVQRKGPLPQYELLSAEGFGTHLPTFHFRVTVGNIVAEGKAHSKKEAKHEAAKNALEKLCAYEPKHTKTSVVPALQSSEHNPALSSISKKTNWLRTIMQTKKLSKEFLWQDIKNRDEADLQNLLNKLDLKYRIEFVDNENETVVLLSINSTPEFTLCEISEMKELALYGAFYKCIKFLEIMTNWQ